MEQQPEAWMLPQALAIDYKDEGVYPISMSRPLQNIIMMKFPGTPECNSPHVLEDGRSRRGRLIASV